MMCLKHIMLFSLLLPMPAASPLFLCLFAASLFFSIRPCGYCLALFAILFLSTSPNSPFITPSPTSTPATNISDSTVSTGPVESTMSNLFAGLPLDAPVPGRTWLSMNAGRVFDPNLVGYREIARIQNRPSQRRKRSISTGIEEEQQQILNERENRETRSFLQGMINRFSPHRLKTIFSNNNKNNNKSSSSNNLDSTSNSRGRSRDEESPLPPGYVDLSWRGVGFIVDFGWKRSEAGLLWEISRMRDALQEAETEHKVETEEEEKEQPETLADASAKEEEKIQETDVHKSRNGYRWGIPLLGNW